MMRAKLPRKRKLKFMTRWLVIGASAWALLCFSTPQLDPVTGARVGWTEQQYVVSKDAKGNKDQQLVLTVTFFTASTTWTVPTDWNNASNQIECIGPGATGAQTGGGSGIGADGAGGGAYASSSNLTYTAGNNITVTLGAIGDATANVDALTTWVNNNANSAVAVLAAGPLCRTGANPRVAGLASGSTGTTKFDGGTGGTGSTSNAGGGGGGAAGQHGAGANAGNASGGTSGAGGNGDAGSGGAGGAATGFGAGNPGSSGTNFDATHGSGGGGSGAGGGFSGGNGGNYGAGGGGGGAGSAAGTGVKGLIRISYTPAVVAGFNMPMLGM